MIDADLGRWPSPLGNVRVRLSDELVVLIESQHVGQTVGACPSALAIGDFAQPVNQSGSASCVGKYCASVVGVAVGEPAPFVDLELAVDQAADRVRLVVGDPRLPH